MMKNAKKWVVGGVLGAALAAAPLAGMAAKEWTMATALPGVFLEDANTYAQLVETMTNGDIKMNVFAPGMLGKDLKVTDIVKSGVAQVGHNWMGYDWGVDKATVIFAGMSGGLQPEELLMYLFQAGGAEMWFEYRKDQFGVASIPCGIFPTELFLHSNKKIETLEDFQGLKMRTAGAWAEIAGRLGASTVILPGAEVYPALERGVIDATEWSSPSVNLSVGLNKIAKYVITPGVHQPGAVQECEFNMDTWNGLTDHEREIMRLAGKVLALHTYTRYPYADIAAVQAMRDYGNEFVQLSPEFLAAANAEATKWAEEQAAENEWFKKAFDHRMAFQNAIRAHWKSQFLFPLGAD